MPEVEFQWPWDSSTPEGKEGKVVSRCLFATHVRPFSFCHFLWLFPADGRRCLSASPDSEKLNVQGEQGPALICPLWLWQLPDRLSRLLHVCKEVTVKRQDQYLLISNSELLCFQAQEKVERFQYIKKGKRGGFLHCDPITQWNTEQLVRMS